MDDSESTSLQPRSFHSMKVEELNDLDLSYTPPLSSPWDPIQMGSASVEPGVSRQRRALLETIVPNKIEPMIRPATTDDAEQIC